MYYIYCVCGFILILDDRIPHRKYITMAKKPNTQQQEWRRPTPRSTVSPQDIKPGDRNATSTESIKDMQNRKAQPNKPHTQRTHKKKKGSKPKLPSTQDAFPKFTNHQRNMWNSINSLLAQQLPEEKTQKRRDISTAIVQTLVKNHYANPPQRQAFIVKDYGDMSPAEIAAKLDNGSATTLRRVNDSYVPNIPTTIALIEQGWLRLPQLTDKGYEVLKEIDKRTI